MDRTLLDELFPLDQPGLSEEQKAQLEEQRMLYQALMVEDIPAAAQIYENSDTFVAIKLEGIHRYAEKAPNNISMRFIVAFKVVFCCCCFFFCCCCVVVVFFVVVFFVVVFLSLFFVVVLFLLFCFCCCR